MSYYIFLLFPRINVFQVVVVMTSYLLHIMCIIGNFAKIHIFLTPQRYINKSNFMNWPYEFNYKI